MWQRIGMIIWKEFRQIRRDPRMLTVVVVMPIMMLLLYGYAINLDVRHVRLGVYDQDRSVESRELIGAFTRSGYFDLIAAPSNPREVTDQLDRGRVRLVLVIPAEYSETLADGRTARIQLLVDGSDSTTASTALGYAGSILQQYAGQVTVRALQRSGLAVRGDWQAIDTRTRYWYNPELKSNNYTIPGLIAVILSMLAALLTSVTIVRERERGTIEQLLVSPIRPGELMLGKLIPYMLLAFVDVVLVMVVALVIFHVPMVGSPVLALALSMLFIMAALGIGLFISTVAPTQQVAMLVAVMATQLPAVLLSGFIFSIRNMPRPVQLLTNIIPATHFIRILRGTFLKGNGLDLLWQPSLVLLIIGVAMILLSAKRFKRTL